MQEGEEVQGREGDESSVVDVFEPTVVDVLCSGAWGYAASAVGPLAVGCILCRGERV